VTTTLAIIIATLLVAGFVAAILRGLHRKRLHSILTECSDGRVETIEEIERA